MDLGGIGLLRAVILRIGAGSFFPCV